MKTDVNVPSKSNKQKKFSKKLVFVGILKINDENSRIRIHTKMSWIRNTGFKSFLLLEPMIGNITKMLLDFAMASLRCLDIITNVSYYIWTVSPDGLSFA